MKDWLSLRGSVVIKVKGARPERFLNSAVRGGVALHNVERLSQSMLVATVSAASFRKLRQLTHAGPWRITILRRLGLPFFLHKLLRRRGLVVGGLLSVLSLYALSSFVWFVNVEGVIGIPKQQILEVAKNYGLRPGASRYSLDTGGVERELLLAIDKLAWATVELRGTLATIRVAEKVTPSDDLTAPGDVVAARDGVLEGIVTLRGIPVAAAGDTVKAGQLLISGLIPAQDPAHGERIAKGEPPYIRAAGIVKARVWYEGTAEAALALRKEILTGRVHRKLIWQWREHSGSLGGEAPFTEHKESTVKAQPGIGPFRLPGSLTYVRQAEVQIEETPIDPDAARETALTAAWEQVQAALPVGASIDKPPQISVEMIDDGSGEVARAKVVVEVTQDIALFQPIANPKPESDAAPVVTPSLRIQPVPGP